MWRQVYRIRLILLCLAVLAGVEVSPAEAAGSRPSSLSRWLSREAIPEIQALLSNHPMYVGQRVRVVGVEANALAEAIATVLHSNLEDAAGNPLPMHTQHAVPLQSKPGSIDELDCRGAPAVDYLLRVSATQAGGGRDRVQLVLVDAGDSAEQARNWQWLGRLNTAERDYRGRPAGPAVVNGSLAAPWGDGDVDAAALVLSRDFACALRPQVESRLDLRWPARMELPALFADTANASRHLLGAYRELAITSGQAAYTVDIRLERFRHDIWQLWLTGTPRLKELAPVQAVAYFRAAGPEWPAPAAAASAAAASAAAAPAAAAPAAAIIVPAIPARVPPPDLGRALDFIDVEVLDATQADLGNSRAQLQVTLRIGNRADWPIEYSFTLSGGHFNHCIARPGYYRHDRYGTVSGSVQAGARVVRRLVIEKAQHRPTPWFGVRKCAGFRDLDGFEEFASQGYKVTDFVRWDL